MHVCTRMRTGVVASHRGSHLRNKRAREGALPMVWTSSRYRRVERWRGVSVADGEAERGGRLGRSATGVGYRRLVPWSGAGLGAGAASPYWCQDGFSRTAAARCWCREIIPMSAPAMSAANCCFNSATLLECHSSSCWVPLTPEHVTRRQAIPNVAACKMSKCAGRS